MKFDLPEFKRFCSALKVDTKELGIVSLGQVLHGAQLYLIDEIARGLNEGCHYFVVLKARQLGMTTICLALDLYWSFKFAGTQGTLITDTDDNRDMFRDTLTTYMEGLTPEWKQQVKTHNRTQLTFGNRSRFLYQVAGTKKKDKRSVGVGKAVLYMHATECSNWGDDGALADIEASLAQKNPRRLYIFESTARGPNGFQDMWETAQSARTQRAIFVGWWRNELYRCEEGSPEYNVYWDGHVTADEVAWSDEVMKLYDYEIQPEQFAWFRWMLAEHVHDEGRMMENYPPTENYAFVMTGSQFFGSNSLSDRMKVARENKPDQYRFVMGENFADTEMIPATGQHANFRMWDPPRANAYYVIGADPAYGSSDWADRFCAQVYRCYSDGMDQVAEYCTSDCSTYQFAWVLIYLAGAYRQAMLNVEINGPGQQVMAEIFNMQRQAQLYAPGLSPEMFQVVANVQNYLYRRRDSMGGGYAFHWKTTHDTKELMMNSFKDGFERGIIQVNSTGCLEEMKNVVREDGVLGAPGRGKDDRVIASALATVAWSDFVRMRVAQSGITRAAAHASDETGRPTSAIARNIMNYLKGRGAIDEAA